MKWRNITSRDLERVISKLSLEAVDKKRRSPHPVYWYYLEGKKTLRITLPNKHGGSGSMSTGFLNQIKNSFRLNNSEFEDLVECPLSAEEYKNILQSRLE